MPQPIRPQKIKRHRIKSFIIIILITLSAFVLVFIGFFALMFNGGFQGLKNRITPMPEPYSTELVDEREKSEKSIDGIFETLEKIHGITYVATGSHDICFRGQANWKHTDSFSNKCTQKVTRFYGYNGNRAESIKEMDKTLKQAGWKASDYSSVDSLSYSKNDENSLVIGFEEKENGIIKGFTNQWAIAGFSEEHNVQNFQNEDKVYAEIAANYPYALTISIQELYFQN